MRRFSVAFGVIFTVLAVIAMLSSPYIATRNVVAIIVDMIFAYIVIVLSAILFETWGETKNSDVRWVCAGFSTLAFLRLFEIYLEAYAYSINYSIKFPTYSVLWAIETWLVVFGMIMVAIGLWGASK